MFEKLSNNLNLLMAETNLNAEELSRRTGLPASTIKKIRNRNNANATLSSLMPLARYFSLTISQLAGDEPLPETRIKGGYNIAPEILTHIPLLCWEEVPNWPTNRNSEYTTIPSEHTYSINAYALLVEEDNWENLTKGTALLVDPALRPAHRDFIIIHKKGQQTSSLKQILYDDGHTYLKPLVQGYTVTPLTPEHKILGVVVEYKKHLKKT